MFRNRIGLVRVLNKRAYRWYCMEAIAAVRVIVSIGAQILNFSSCTRRIKTDRYEQICAASMEETSRGFQCFGEQCQRHLRQETKTDPTMVAIRAAGTAQLAMQASCTAKEHL